MLIERIKELCKAQGISIPKLEDRLGFGAGTISKWKTSSPSADKIKKVAEYFHVSVDYLLGVEDSAYYTNAETELMIQKLRNNPHFRIMFDDMKDMDIKTLEKIVDFIMYQRHLEGHDDE